MKKPWTWALVTLLLAMPAGAQEKEEAVRGEAAPPAKSATPPRANSITPLRVQLVLSKYQGERKVVSLPYTMTCNADDRGGVMLRMGVEVPVPMRPSESGPTTFSYKNVGMGIDCRASSVEGGRYRVELTVEHSSVYAPLEDKLRAADSAGLNSGPGAAPVFRTFKSNFNPLLRDGQTVQYTTATDPVSGEVVKIDVTLTVLR